MDYSFRELIERVDAVESSVIPERIKLERSGALIYQGSLEILNKTKAILHDIRHSEVKKGDTKIDDSFTYFLASLTQQNISTNFLKKYLQPQPKTKYERNTTVKIQSLTPVEALLEFDTDLIESEVISLAHDENINAWINLVNECFEADPKIKSLPQIVQTTSLSLAQVFISLLFGGFILKQDDSFYEGDSIQVEKRQSTEDGRLTN
jgi:hypothetical protein